MTEPAESNLPTMVKPRSTWVITSKTSPMNPIEPLYQVYTHPWSTIGQRHGQNRLNRWRQQMSSITFAAFSKIHLNTSKSTFMKVVHLVEGHNFHVECHFKFWVEIGGKLDQLTVPPIFRNMAAFKVGTTFVTSLDLVWIQNVEFQKLELYLSAHESIKGVFLFLSPIPRFNFGTDNNFRTYNLLVWEVGSSFEFYLGFYLSGFKFELEFKFESN
jgi:hypothetical protein